MEPLQRVTAATVDVLRVLLSSAEPAWGLLLIKSTNRPAGTVYPILERLERSGWVTSAWEDDPARPGPRRKLYKLTADGVVAARSTCSAWDARRVGGGRAEPGRLATS